MFQRQARPLGQDKKTFHCASAAKHQMCPVSAWFAKGSMRQEMPGERDRCCQQGETAGSHHPPKVCLEASPSILIRQSLPGQLHSQQA